MANAFTNIDLTEQLAARKAVLEAHRQRLIAYDSNPIPRSPDLVEPANTDANADGYVWNNVTGRWEVEGAGGGEIDIEGVLVSDNNLSDVTNPTEAASNLGIHAVGTLSNPRVLLPVKWYWGTTNEEIVGTENPSYVDGVITAVDGDEGDPLPGAIPDPITGPLTNETIVPIGSADNVAIGIQAGDRVFFDERVNYGHQGVYVVTNVGDGSSPWVLTRATDHPESEILDAFIVQVEGTPIIIRTTQLGNDPEYISPSLSFGNGSIATGEGAIAVGAESLVFGKNSIAWGVASMALGPESQALGDGSITIGHSTYNEIPNTVKVSGAIVRNFWSVGFAEWLVDGVYTLPEGGWLEIFVGEDTEFTGGPSETGGTVTVSMTGDGGPWNLTWDLNWTFLGDTPTTIADGKTTLLTVSKFDNHTLVTAAVEP